MKITDEKGVEVDDVIGPFDEDSTLILVCIVIGGKYHVPLLLFFLLFGFFFCFVLLL